MSNRKFRLSSIINTLWLSGRKTATPNPKVMITQGSKPQHEKPGQSIQTFDEMLLFSSSFRTERLTRCPETEQALLPPPLTVAQLRRPSVYRSSNSNYSPRRRKVHSRSRSKVKSPRINAMNDRRRASNSSSSCSSGKRMTLLESSVTVVKSSDNPESEFKESMMEMIVENNITDLDGLAELLVSYLVLNSDEFHEIIVTVFKHIVVGLFTKPKNLTF
ncbi:hypothetical protein QQ045_016238 [Rhodiola kirilowii]